MHCMLDLIDLILAHIIGLGSNENPLNQLMGLTRISGVTYSTYVYVSAIMVLLILRV